MELLVALHFLTVIPVPLPARLPDDAWGRSMAYFPVVGFLLGLLLLLGKYLLLHVWPPGVVAAVLLGIWIVLTGALHLDGFVDCCDGLLVAKSPTERLAILRDPHAGTFGVVGVVTLLLVKYTCLWAGQASFGLTDQALWLAPLLGRWTMVYAAVVYPYGREGSSLGGLFVQHVQRRSLFIASLAAIVLGAAVGGWFGLAALVFVWVLVILMARWTLTRIPGLTGDVYGAINELVEVAVLLLGLAVARG